MIAHATIACARKTCHHGCIRPWPIDNPLASVKSCAEGGASKMVENKKELVFFIVMGCLVAVAGIAVVSRFI